MIEYIKKDITTVDKGVIAHGVNCWGVMGAGVAKAVRDKWPDVYTTYMHTCRGCAASKEVLLGRCEIVWLQSGLGSAFGVLHVANLYTQLNYGKDGKAYASVDAIDKALGECFDFCNTKRMPLFMPRIGCGLGGLSWNTDVLPIVEKHATFYGVPVFVCDL